jgi:PAS domain S-box-containing protein/putative nucleotidyltransferase with HDIG domain
MPLNGNRAKGGEMKFEETKGGLKRIEDCYRDLVEQAGIAILINDKEGNLQFINKKCEDVFGYSVNEMLNLPSRPIIHPEDFEMVTKYHKGRVVGKIVPSRYEFRGIKKNGSTIYLEVTASPLKIRNKIYGTRAYMWDITDRKKMEKELSDTLEVLRKTTGTIIEVIGKMLEMKDPFTSGHQRRAADLARTMAKEPGLPTERIDGIRVAALIHDIGKISIPTEILNKPGPLNEKEFDIIKSHPKIAHEILKTINFPWPVAETVHQHHERINGSGYPLGLSDNDILLEARILGVADVVEAMNSNRPYRPAPGLNKALEEISKNSGILYDPEVVNVCSRVFKKGFKFKSEESELIPVEAKYEIFSLTTEKRCPSCGSVEVGPSGQDHRLRDFEKRIGFKCNKCGTKFLMSESEHKS